jgi:crossover junction endodeoxyribonuclease RuvC
VGAKNMTVDRTAKTTIMGIDPGSQKTGWGLITLCVRSRKIMHVDNGVIMLDKKEPLVDRLVDLSATLSTLVKKYKPDEAAVEDVFVAKSAKSALVLGQARGAVLASVGMCGVRLSSYSSTRVKSVVTGQGKADKDQVALWVCQHLGLPEVPFEDAADALAVAITHALSLLSPTPEQVSSTTTPRKKKGNSRRSLAALARQQGKL